MEKDLKDLQMGTVELMKSNINCDQCKTETIEGLQLEEKCDIRPELEGDNDRERFAELAFKYSHSASIPVKSGKKRKERIESSREELIASTALTKMSLAVPTYRQHRTIVAVSSSSSDSEAKRRKSEASKMEWKKREPEDFAQLMDFDEEDEYEEEDKKVEEDDEEFHPQFHTLFRQSNNSLSTNFASSDASAILNMDVAEGTTLVDVPPSGIHQLLDSASAAKRKGKLPQKATNILKEWIFEHLTNPYPAEDQKVILCNQTGLTTNQLNNWFTNARRRLLRKVAQSNPEIPIFHT
jgi:hypothetical protein